jgi:uncharacterized peroxidase-related enzyme
MSPGPISQILANTISGVSANPATIRLRMLSSDRSLATDSATAWRNSRFIPQVVRNVVACQRIFVFDEISLLYIRSRSPRKPLSTHPLRTTIWIGTVLVWDYCEDERLNQGKEYYVSRFRLLEPQQAAPKARDLLEGVQNKLGRLPNIFKAMANSPAALAAYLCIGEALEDGRLSAKLREQIALTVAEINGSPYCLAAHAATGRKVGLSKDEIISNRRAQSSDQSVSTVLIFVRTLVAQRGDVLSEDVDQLRDAGFDDGQIAEIVVTVALNILTNYFNMAAGTPVDFPNTEALPPNYAL